MNVGDLVKYGSWYAGDYRVGLILEESAAFDDKYYLVAWREGWEWESTDEIEVVSECR